MQRLLRLLAIIMIVTALAPMAQAGAAADQPQTHPDDELVIITSDGRLASRDPDVPSGFQAVAWESPQTGFTNVVAGDFNGDGSDEVAGARTNEVVIYDPVVRSGEANVTHTFTASAGQTWQHMVVGDLDSDGRDDLVIVESKAGGGSTLFAYKFTPGSGWMQTFSQVHGVSWTAFATGKIMGNNRDQIVGIRNLAPNFQILIWDPANNWQAIHEKSYTFPWVTVEVGNVAADPSNKDELVFSRAGVLGVRQSILVLRWVSNTAPLEDVTAEYAYPEFPWIALADVNGSGDQEMFFLRPGRFNNTNIVGLTTRNYGSDPATSFDDLTGVDKFRRIHAGDLNGDGRDEVIIMAADEYMVYTNPAVNNTKVSYPGSYSSTGNFAVANLDGPGRLIGPDLSVSPLNFTLTLQSGQSSTQSVAITNIGAGTINWTAAVTAGANWLLISPASGTAPSTLSLLIDTTGMSPGSYTGTVVVTGNSGVFNSPQTITVALTVTAPPFSVQPTWVSWLYQTGNNPGVRTVSVMGANIPWHAGAVPIWGAARIEQAIAAGQPVKWVDNTVVIGDGVDGVPIVNWIDINPLTGVALPSGVSVDLSLVTAQVPMGFSQAAVVFVADTTANPPAVVVRASVLRTTSDMSDVIFLPLMGRNAR